MLTIGLGIIVLLMCAIWYGIITIIKRADTEQVVMYHGVKGEQITVKQQEEQDGYDGLGL